MKKFLRVTGVLLLVVIVALLVVVSMFLGNVIKAGVETAGPSVVGVPLALDKAAVHPLRGTVALSGFVVGNPEGFKSDHAFKLGSFNLDMKPKSVFEDKIVIDEIVIDSPEIIYELSMSGSNIGSLLDGLKKKAAEATPAEETPDDPAAEGKPQKTVQINNLYVRNAKVKVTSKLLQGKGATLTLPEIHLTDIGKDKEKGASFVDVTGEVIGAVLGSVVGAVKGSGDLVGDLAGAGLNVVGELGGAGLKAGKAILKGGAAAAGKATELVGDAAGKATEVAGDLAGKGATAAGDAAKAAGDLAGKGVGAAGNAAKAVGSAAGDTAKAVGSATKDGAAKALKGVGGLFKKGDKKTDD